SLTPIGATEAPAQGPPAMHGQALWDRLQAASDQDGRRMGAGNYGLTTLTHPDEINDLVQQLGVREAGGPRRIAGLIEGALGDTAPGTRAYWEQAIDNVWREHNESIPGLRTPWEESESFRGLINEGKVSLSRQGIADIDSDVLIAPIASVDH